MSYIAELHNNPKYQKIDAHRDYWRDVYFRLPKWVRKIIRRRFWAWDKEQYRVMAEIEYHIWKRRLRNYDKQRWATRSLYMDVPQ